MKKRTIFFFLGLVCLFGRVEIVVGQEVAAHPVSPAGEGGGAPVVVYGTVLADHQPDPIELSVFRNYTFNSRRAPGVHTVSLDYRSGNMVEGRMPNEKTFEYIFPHLEDLAYLSMAFGNDHAFIDRFAILPGDTLEVYVDRRFGALHFAGNAVDRMELQHALARMNRREELFRQPVMVSQNPENVMSDPRFAEKYRALGEAGRRRMIFIQPGEEEVTRLLRPDGVDGRAPLQKQLDLISESPIMDNLKQILSDNLRAQNFAVLISQVSGGLHLAQRRGDLELLEKLKDIVYEDLVEKVEPWLERNWHPDAFGPVDLFAQWANLDRRLKNIDRYEAIMKLSNSQIRDRVAVDYFYNQYEFVEAAQQQMEDYLEVVSDPFSRSSLENFFALRREGGELKHFDFVDDKGKPFDEEGLRGKVTLLDFYITGCGASKGFFEKAVKPLLLEFGNREDFQVITISADRSEEIWKESLNSGHYTSDSTINLFTDGSSHSHPFLISYGIYGFPSKMIIGKNGTVLKSAGIPATYEALKEIIEQALQEGS